MMLRPDVSRIALTISLILTSSLGWAQAEWSAETHTLSVGDFNGDGRADLLVIAHDPWRTSGVVVTPGGGQTPSYIFDSFTSDHLGIEWHGQNHRPVIASINPPECLGGSSCTPCTNFYFDDVLLLRDSAGPHHAVFIRNSTRKLDDLARSFVDPNIGIDWSQDKNRVVAGLLNASDQYDDLFFQPLTTGNQFHLVQGSTATVFEDVTKITQSEADGWLGFNWSFDNAVVHIGNFNGDLIDDVLVQGRTASDKFGVVYDADDNLVLDTEYLSWQIDELVPDWSADNYQLHVGNFDGDNYDDVLLQPISGSGPVYIVLFKALDAGGNPTNFVISTFSSSEQGLNWTAAGSLLHVGDFNLDGKADLYVQSLLASGANFVAQLTTPAQSGQPTQVNLIAAPEPSLDPTPNPTPTSGTAAGHTAAEFSVDSTGAAIYRVPIEVPPGVRGMQPDLALVYNSRAGNGLLGVGWTLAGLSTIQRCPAIADPAVDGFADGVDLDADDRYCLDGQRLIETGTANSFRTDIWTNQRITALGAQGNGPDHFTVEDRAGLTREYGNTFDSQVRPGAEFIGESPQVLVYAVNKATDKFGNSIDYKYAQPETTEYWPTEITYSNSSGEVVGKVVFSYDNSRADFMSGFFQDWPLDRSRRLTKITTYTRGQSGAGTDVPVKAYHLSYEYSQRNNLSHLGSILECELTTGKCVEETDFTVETGSRGFVATAIDTNVDINDLTALQILDVNNNGIPDYAYVNGSDQWEVRLDGVTNPPAPDKLAAIDWNPGDSKRGIPLDFNGDGYMDLAQASGLHSSPSSVIQILLGGSQGFSQAVNTSLAIMNRSFKVGTPVADINGDGLDDLVTVFGDQIEVFESTGTDFSSQPLTGYITPGSLTPTVVGEVRRLHFNSDGVEDLLIQTADCITFQGSTTCFDHEWVVYSNLRSTTSTGDDLERVYVLPGDFMQSSKLLDANGDGLTDLLYHHADNNTWVLKIADGAGYIQWWSRASETVYQFSDEPASSFSMSSTPHDWQSGSGKVLSLTNDLLQDAKPLDYDRDGDTDLLYKDPNTNRWEALIIDDKFFVATIDTFKPAENEGAAAFLDVGGDGVADLLYPDSTGDFQIYHARGPLGDLVTQIEDGLGARTKLGYSALTDGEIYLGHGPFEDTGTTMVFPYRHFADPSLIVVKSYGAPAGLGADDVISTHYEYRGGKWHSQGRGFVGFAEIRAWNENREIETVNKIWQQFPYTGMVSESLQRVDESAPLVTVQIPFGGTITYPASCETDPTGSECQQWFDAGGGTPSGETGQGAVINKTTSVLNHNTILTAEFGTSELPFIEQTTELLYPVPTGGSIGSSPFKRIVTTYHTATNPIDSKGNPDIITVVTDDGAGNDVHTVTTDNDWANTTSTWCLSKLQSVTVTTDAPGTGPIVRQTNFGYTSQCELLVETIEPNNNDHKVTKTYGYDAHGNRTSETISGPSFATRATTMEYGDEYHGRFPTRLTNALGHVIEQSWDVRAGRRSSEIGPKVDAASGSTLARNWTYDGFGRQVTARATRAAAFTTSSYEWCSEVGCNSGMGITRTSVSGSDGSQQTTEFDRLNRVVHTTALGFDGSQIHVDRAFDPLGREHAISAPYFTAEQTSRCYVFRQFDVLDRVTFENAPSQESQCVADEPPLFTIQAPTGGRQTRAFHDVAHASGIQTRVETETSGLVSGGTTWRVRREVRNVMDRTVLVSEDLGAGTVDTQYTYYADGNVWTITDAEGAVTTFTYDVLGNKNTVNDPNMGQWSYDHNALGELRSQIDAKGQATGLEYDLLGRLKRRLDQFNAAVPTDPDQEISEWFYDSAAGEGVGRLARVVGPYRLGDGESSAEYDETRNYNEYGEPADVIRKIYTGTVYEYFWTSSAFDSQGRLSTLTNPSHDGNGTSSSPGGSREAVYYRYNQYGFLSKACRFANCGQIYWEAAGMDAFGNYSQFDLDNGQMTTYRLRDRATGAMTGTSTTRGAVTVQDLLYQWTDGLDIERREDRKNGYHETFQYDELQRLDIVELHLGPSLIKTINMDYDKTGSIEQKGADYTNYQYDTTQPDQVTGVTAGGVSRSYQYDSNGNMTDRGNDTITWTTYNKPAVINDGPDRSEFFYGPSRQRFRQKATRAEGVDTIAYAGALFEKIETYRPGGPEYRIAFRAGNEIVAIRTRTSSSLLRTEYLHRDHLGSVSAITNGATVTHVAYDVWGKRFDPTALSAQNPMLPPGEFYDPDLSITSVLRGYTQHEHLDHVGLVHMNGRVFDPEIGRFISADLFVQFPFSTQGQDRYAYTLNRPLTFTDPSGFFLGEIIGAIVVNSIIQSVFATAQNFANADARVSISVNGFLNGGGVFGSGVSAVRTTGVPDFSGIFTIRPEDLILTSVAGIENARASADDVVGKRIEAGIVGDFHPAGASGADQRDGTGVRVMVAEVGSVVARGRESDRRLDTQGGLFLLITGVMDLGEVQELSRFVNSNATTNEELRERFPHLPPVNDAKFPVARELLRQDLARHLIRSLHATLEGGVTFTEEMLASLTINRLAKLLGVPKRTLEAIDIGLRAGDIPMEQTERPTIEERIKDRPPFK